MYIDREKHLAHIGDPDKNLKMRRIIDKMEMVIKNHFQESTDFLDPYERFLAKSILNGFLELDYIEDGGIDESERQIITIFPSYIEKDSLDIEIEGIRIRGDIDSLNHKDYLGSLIGLGINRNKIGDILLYEDYTDIVCKREISDFIIFNLEKVGNKRVDLKKISLDNLTAPELKFKDIFKIISSYRLDVYISSCYNLSRNDAVKIIKSGKVKVNWEETLKPSRELKVGDNISVRGYGRSILYSVQGVTKKDNIKAVIRILI